MNAFIVEAQNRPGELARIAGILGDRGINITSGAVLGLSSAGGFGFLTNDEAGAKSTLEAAGVMYREVAVIPVSIEDAPGALAGIARRLGEAGVNIELVVPTGMSGGKMTLAVGVDNVEKARASIGEMVGAA